MIIGVRVCDSDRDVGTSFFERVLQMQTEKWFSMKDICKHLGVSRDTVIKWVNEKDMPGTHIGRLWKFDPDEVDEWMKAYRQKQHEEK